MQLALGLCCGCVLCCVESAVINGERKREGLQCASLLCAPSILYGFFLKLNSFLFSPALSRGGGLAGIGYTKRKDYEYSHHTARSQTNQTVTALSVTYIVL